MEGDIFDSAEGCGLLSSNKPLEQLRDHFPHEEEILRNQIISLGNEFLDYFRDFMPDTDCDSVLLFFKAFDVDSTLPVEKLVVGDQIEYDNGLINNSCSNNDNNNSVQNNNNIQNNNNTLNNAQNNNNNTQNNNDNNTERELSYEEMKHIEAANDPLKHLGSCMFNKTSKLCDVINVCNILLHSQYQIQNQQNENENNDDIQNENEGPNGNENGSGNNNNGNGNGDDNDDDTQPLQLTSSPTSSSGHGSGSGIGSGSGPGSVSGSGSVVVPEMWRNELEYTICKSLSDCQLDVVDEERIRSPYLHEVMNCVSCL